jgi:ParB family transcriptional regulator, chromosome partitioning protein
MSIKGIASLADLMEDLPAAGSQEVALSLIDPDPHQPRTSFDELRLDTLAASVAAQGVIEPLIVSLHPDTPGRYLLVAGERRWRAAGMAGLTTVAVVIRELTAEQRLAVQLIENIDREALSILEESSAVVRLIEFGRKPKDVAGMLGKTQAWVSLRRKIADHRSGLESFVAEERTRDAETLAMLVDLEKIDRQAFSDMHQVERITRAAVREALDRAKLRKLAPVVPATTLEAPAPVPTETPAQPQPRDEAPAAPQVPEPPRVTESTPVEADNTRPSVAAKPKAVPTHPQPAVNQDQADRFEEARRAVQAALGLPVSIHAPHAGKPGELRISFADLLELDALRQNLT